MQKPRIRKPDLRNLGKSVLILPGMYSYIANVPNRNRLWASKQFVIILLSKVNSLFHINVIFISKNMLPDVLLTSPHQQILQEERGWLDIPNSKDPYDLFSACPGYFPDSKNMKWKQQILWVNSLFLCIKELGKVFIFYIGS